MRERAEADHVVVRKYGNRRLYRTDESRYVTLDELSQLVREDVDFQVLDAKSGQDITGIVLAQVILEEEKRAKGSVFPVELLRQLIRVRDPALTEFVTHHLPRLTGIYLESRRALGESLDLAARGEANQGEAVIISQLSAVHKQLRQLLDVLEVEDIE